MRDLILSIAQFGVRSIIGIVAVLFGELIILIKAVGDELRHPPFNVIPVIYSSVHMQIGAEKKGGSNYWLSAFLANDLLPITLKERRWKVA